jgi:signal transduction histidine kinase
LGISLRQPLALDTSIMAPFDSTVMTSLWAFVAVGAAIAILVLEVRYHLTRRSQYSFAAMLGGACQVFSTTGAALAAAGLLSTLTPLIIARLTASVLSIMCSAIHVVGLARSASRTRQALHQLQLCVRSAQDVTTQLQARAERAEADAQASQGDSHAAQMLLRQAEAARATFISRVSHELRTPMSGVTPMVKMLMETPLNEQQRECVQTIDASAAALQQVLGDVLDLASIESGGIVRQTAGPVLVVLGSHPLGVCSNCNHRCSTCGRLWRRRLMRWPAR